MSIRRVSPGEIREHNRIDPEFFVSPATVRDWNVPRKPLGEVAEVFRRSKIKNPSDHHPWFLTEHQINPLNPHLQTNLKERPERVQEAKEGDLLLHRSNYRKCYYVNESCLVPYDFWIIECSSGLVPEFATIVLRSTFLKDEFNRIGTNTSKRRLSKKMLVEVPVPVPDLSTQNEIVKQYRSNVPDPSPEKICEVIRQIQERAGYVSADARGIFRADAENMIERMDPGFYRPKRYRYEGDWPQYPLEDLVKVNIRRAQEDETLKNEHENREYRAFSSRQVNLLTICPEEKDPQFREPDERDLTPRKKDIILDQNLRDGISAAVFYGDSPFLLRRGCFLLRPTTKDCSPLYLAAILTSSALTEELSRKAYPGSRIPRLNRTNICSVQIPLPPRKKQEEWIEPLKEQIQGEVPLLYASTFTDQLLTNHLISG